MIAGSIGQFILRVCRTRHAGVDSGGLHDRTLPGCQGECRAVKRFERKPVLPKSGETRSLPYNPFSAGWLSDECVAGGGPVIERGCKRKDNDTGLRVGEKRKFGEF
jgi:hypothetical protein